MNLGASTIPWSADFIQISTSFAMNALVPAQDPLLTPTWLLPRLPRLPAPGIAPHSSSLSFMISTLFEEYRWVIL